MSSTRASRFTAFKNRVERTESWPSAFSQALALALVGTQCSPIELAERLGLRPSNISYLIITPTLPQPKNVLRIESALGLEQGDLERHIAVGERYAKQRLRLKTVWRDRKKNYSRARFDEKLRAGEWDGRSPAAAGPKSGNTRTGMLLGPVSLQVRIRKAVPRYTYSGGRFGPDSNFFVVCGLCQKALWRAKGKPGRGLHFACWTSWLLDGNAWRDSRFPQGRDVSKPVRFWLEHHVLGKSFRQIAELHGLFDGREAVRKTVLRAERWLPHVWGELVAKKGVGRGNVNKLLYNVPISEVAQIAKGEHPMSRCSDAQELKVWSDSYDTAADQLWKFTQPIADTPLAQLLASRVDGRFHSKNEAARAIGIDHGALNRVLFEGHLALRQKAVTALSQFLGKAEPELKAMLVESPAPVNGARIQELEIELNQLRGLPDPETLP